MFLTGLSCLAHLRLYNLFVCLCVHNVDMKIWLPFCLQITWLPDPFFWSGLPRLRILHLHDNPIGDIENIHYMASCPALEVSLKTAILVKIRRLIRTYYVLLAPLVKFAQRLRYLRAGNAMLLWHLLRCIESNN